MPVIKFPDPRTADYNGLVAIGGDFHESTLKLAYEMGIFPWPINDHYPLAWFSPDPRGILFVEEFHVSKSLKKLINQKKFRVEFNQQFEKVIRLCATSKNRDASCPQTWITEEIISSYINLYHSGHAYSVEAYNLKNELVGGLYGVSFGKIISGESMFYLESNASKVCLYYLIRHLKKHQIEFLDTQMVTSVVGSLGAREISREDFLEKISQLKKQNYSIWAD